MYPDSNRSKRYDQVRDRDVDSQSRSRSNTPKGPVPPPGRTTRYDAARDTVVPIPQDNTLGEQRWPATTEDASSAPHAPSRLINPAFPTEYAAFAPMPQRLPDPRPTYPGRELPNPALIPPSRHPDYDRPPVHTLERDRLAYQDRIRGQHPGGRDPVAEAEERQGLRFGCPPSGSIDLSEGYTVRSEYAPEPYQAPDSLQQILGDEFAPAPELARLSRTSDRSQGRWNNPRSLYPYDAGSGR